jgi:hypothetical protein
VDRPLPEDIEAEIHDKVDVHALEATLMAEGSKKFADPQKAILALLKQKREKLVSGARAS